VGCTRIWKRPPAAATPALLPGPDRIEIHHVTGYHLTTATAAGMKGR